MPEATDSRRRRALWMLVLANLYWGLSFPLIKAITALNRILVPDGGTWFFAVGALAPRFLLAAVLLLLCQRRRGGKVTALEFKQGAGIAFFACAGSLLQTDALQFTEASTSSFLTQLSAILIPAWIAFRHRRSPGWVVWAACALVLVGVAVLGHLDLSHLKLGRGEWETMLCAVFFGGQIVWLARGEFAGNRPEVVTLLMFTCQAFVFVSLAAVTAPHWAALAAPWQSTPWVVLALVMAVVCTIGAFSIMNTWQPRIGTTQAGLIYCIEPLFASIFALFLPGWISRWAPIDYPNEKATSALIVGGGIITLANVLIQFDAPKPARSPAKPV